MAYKVKKTPLFNKQMLKLDKPIRSRIADYIEDVIEKLDNPKAVAKPLLGRFKGYHRFRIND